MNCNIMYFFNICCISGIFLVYTDITVAQKIGRDSRDTLLTFACDRTFAQIWAYSPPDTTVGSKVNFQFELRWPDISG